MARPVAAAVDSSPPFRPSSQRPVTPSCRAATRRLVFIDCRSSVVISAAAPPSCLAACLRGQAFARAVVMLGCCLLEARLRRLPNFSAALLLAVLLLLCSCIHVLLAACQHCICILVLVSTAISSVLVSCPVSISVMPVLVLSIQVQLHTFSSSMLCESTNSLSDQSIFFFMVS